MKLHHPGRAAALPHRKGSAQVFLMSAHAPSFGGFSGTIHQKETPGQTQNFFEGFYTSCSLATP